MTCSRGRANPDALVKVQLFASSGGYCQNPQCNRALFLNAGGGTIHLAEMAHILAAQDAGPRADNRLAEEDRGRFENLILLCPTCHTLIDKAPEQYPDVTIRGWKAEHEHRLSELFGVRVYYDRRSARQSVEALLRENAAIFRDLNPNLDYRFNPEAEEADRWRHAMIAQIVPNNRRLLMIVDANRKLLTDAEHDATERFRLHVSGLINRHLGDGRRIGAPQFPEDFGNVFLDHG